MNHPNALNFAVTPKKISWEEIVCGVVSSMKPRSKLDSEEISLETIKILKDAKSSTNI